MKLLWVLPILLIACQESKYSVGECIQKPDEIFRYKIISINENEAELEAINNGPLKTAALNKSMWTLTNCH